MQPTNHMDFGHALSQSILDNGNDLTGRLLKRMRVSLLRRECAELARENANIRVVNVPVVNVGRVVAVPLFARD